MTERYPYIRAWHALTGSMPYYWENLKEKAEQMDAPQDALYYREHSGWVCVSDLTADHPMRARMDNYLRNYPPCP